MASKSDEQPLESTKMEISVWTPPPCLEPKIEVVELGDEEMHPTGARVMVGKLGMALEIVRHHGVSLVEPLYKKPLLVAWRLEKRTSNDPTSY